MNDMGQFMIIWSLIHLISLSLLLNYCETCIRIWKRPTKMYVGNTIYYGTHSVGASHDAPLSFDQPVGPCYFRCTLQLLIRKVIHKILRPHQCYSGASPRTFCFLFISLRRDHLELSWVYNQTNEGRSLCCCAEKSDPPHLVPHKPTITH